MKKHSGSKWLCGILALLSAMTITVLAASYDSSEDPIISLSYLESVFRPKLVEEYEAKIATLEAKVDALSGGTYTPDTSVPAETEPATDTTTTIGTTYVVEELAYGDCLYAEGPVDILLRSGSAMCISNENPSQGISDYTEGMEIYHGEDLTINHMCLIPRGDGRGIMAKAQSVFVMVRGEYRIERAPS